jgi:hypothetical protein
MLRLFAFIVCDATYIMDMTKDKVVLAARVHKVEPDRAKMEIDDRGPGQICLYAA